MCGYGRAGLMAPEYEVISVFLVRKDMDLVSLGLYSIYRE